MNRQRRDFMLSMGLGAVALGLADQAGAKQVGGGGVSGDGYFLSAENPIANRDQRDLEALAVELFALPEMQREIQRTAAYFAAVTSNTVSPEAWSMFDAFIQSYCFRSITVAVNSDANHPKVLRVYNPAAKWLGNTVPESRWGAENPDNCYRIIPVERGGRYVIHGQVPKNPPSHSSFVLVADTNTSVTESMLELKDMDIRPDGSFTITLDDAQTAGRKNHFQLTPFARYVFNRDSMGDWMQTPNPLWVERLNPPARGPLTREELIDRSARVMHDGAAQLYYWIRTSFNLPEGQMRKPVGTGPSGGLLTQIISGGRFRLNEEEAFVITVDPVDAAYFSAVLYDPWERSLEYRDHQTSLNNSQMAADANGRFTFVIAHRDPGVHNWLETTGLQDLHVTWRWQGVTHTAKRDPEIDARAVKLGELGSTLQSGVRMVTPSERAQQKLVRQRGYDRRFLDT